MIRQTLRSGVVNRNSRGERGIQRLDLSVRGQIINPLAGPQAHLTYILFTHGKGLAAKMLP